MEAHVKSDSIKLVIFVDIDSHVHATTSLASRRGAQVRRVETICQMERITHTVHLSYRRPINHISIFLTISERVFSQIMATILTPISQTPIVSVKVKHNVVTSF